MNAVTSFIADVQNMGTTSDVHIAFEDFLKTCGFRHFACGSHVDSTQQPSGSVLIENYPDEWAEHYREQQLYLSDPTLSYCRQKLTGFSWSDADFTRSLTQAQAEMLLEVGRFGVKLGHTIPFHFSGHFPASLTVAGTADAMQQENILAVQLIAPFLYQKLYEIERSRHGQGQKPTVRLSDLEYKCLVFAAQGKSDWDIAQICGLTTSSVAHALERMRKKFGVSSRVQATVHALHHGYLEFHTIMNP